MEKNNQGSNTRKNAMSPLKKRYQALILRVKTLHGDPHYIAMGMGIGVFVSATPTIPFHTVIAILLAFVLKGSKPAAAIGVWFSNPITIPVLYIWSYKAGIFLWGDSDSELQVILNFIHSMESELLFSEKYHILFQFLKHEFGVACSMVAGGMIIGILPGILAYFLTRNIFTAIHLKKLTGQFKPGH